MDYKVPAGNPEKPQGADGYALLERMNAGHHEMLANWGLSYLSLADDARVLDCGCGGGANLLRLLATAPAGKVCGIDYSDVSVNLSRETCAAQIQAGQVEVVQGDVGALPFDDGTFDAATAFETVYFWPDFAGALAQIKRVLKPGGVLFICNESDGSSEKDQAIAEQIDVMTLYTPAQLKDAVREAGFANLRVMHDRTRGYVCVLAEKPRA
jgi:ubiquinone/menaquinone biosynthesis C-methylase UbiE